MFTLLIILCLDTKKINTTFFTESHSCLKNLQSLRSTLSITPRSI